MNTDIGAPRGDEDKGYTLVVVTWVECTISILLVALRMFSRTKITRSIGWDDWFMCFSLAFTIAFSICVNIYTANGGGRHVIYLTLEQAILAEKLSWIILTLAIAAITTGKASVALLILRLIGPSKWRKRFLYTISISGFVLGGTAIIIIYSQCQPPRALWDPSAGRCPYLTATNNFHIFVSSFFAFASFILAVLPITIILNLQVSTKKKVGLSIVLGLGIFAAVCTAIRTSFLPELSIRSDFTWIIVNLLIWNATEINVIIIAACIPVLQSLSAMILDKIKGTFDAIKKPKYNSRYGIDLHIGAGKGSITNIAMKGGGSGEQGDGDWMNDGSYPDLIAPITDAPNRIRRVTDIDVTFRDRQSGK